VLLLAVMSVLAAAECARDHVIVCCRQEVVWIMALVAGSSQHRHERMTIRGNVTQTNVAHGFTDVVQP